LNAERTDGKRGVFALEAGFEGGDAPVTLSLSLDEEPGGIAAQVLDLPGMPSVALELDGSGPLDDFTFFGDDLQLVVSGAQGADGAVTLDALMLDTQALRLSGEVALDGDSWPVRLNLTGDLGAADGTPVLLPLPGEETRVDSATLRLSYDAATGQSWQGVFNAEGFSRPGMVLETLALDADGTG